MAPTTTSLPNDTTPPADEGTAVRLTIIYDNTAYDPRFAAAWGFAALVEASGSRLLFDTGGEGALLLGNMALLGIDPSTLDAVVLSHEHQDHTGGLAALLHAGAAPTVYLPASFSPGFRESVAARTEVVEITGPLEILPGVFSTGEMGDGIVEQALVIDTPVGAVVISGCAHPGIVDMVRRAQEVSPGEVALVVGGFHLGGATPVQIESIIAAFRELGVRQVAPAHCTGAPATEAFAREYGDDFVEAGVGRVIEVG
jgi:7,8-dihydropterin-6-yl-methyl-4-(beta-D-ribofuranosyl)aminobenzene 5'-phosphate synthase